MEAKKEPHLEITISEIEKTKSEIENLPTEILIKCFSYLDMETLNQVLKVCKTFKKALESNYAASMYQDIIKSNFDSKTGFFKYNGKLLSLQQIAQKLPPEKLHHAITISDETEKATLKKKSVIRSLEFEPTTGFEDISPKAYKASIPFSICYLYYSYYQNDMRGLFKAFVLLFPAIVIMFNSCRRYSLGNSAAYYSTRIEMLENKKTELMTGVDIESNSNNPDAAPKKNN